MPDPASSSAAPFSPPSAEQVAAHLASNPPRAQSKSAGYAALLAIGFAMALMFSSPDGLMPLVGMLVVAGVFVYLFRRGLRMRDLERRASRAAELALTHHAPQSLRLAWQLLPGVTAVPQLHGRTVAMIAQNLDRLRQFDGAVVAYDELIKRLPRDHPAAVHFRILRAMAHLFCDRLADADDELRKVRNVIDRFVDTAVAAAYRLAELFQRIRTHHFDDALGLADNLLDDLRPLGVEAGYGHALMALSYMKFADKHDDASAAEQGGQWWGRATMLLTTEQLVFRHEELRELSDDPRLAVHTQSSTPPVET